MLPVGDLWFHSQRRAWMQAANKFGVKTFGYLFTDPGAPPLAPPLLDPQRTMLSVVRILQSYSFKYCESHRVNRPFTVTHTADLIYVYGLNGRFGRPASAIALGTQMIDYWVSFATSLDPNDGRGSARPVWSQYTSSNKTILELTSANMSMIPDDYRAQQIDFINYNAAIFAR
ncbi:Carboxylic ester hydrolase [Mycena venus]|uniref:Carboxylic ester hydrolase n=1 Tax=Mycena venus TaxID=2733690 RepID=A0A8H6Y0D2_9AGAR|nr:Carboxylic ester hydrolase [Mycena venus]